MSERPRRELQRGIYRTLLFLYPRSFRREYGREMTQAFSDRLNDRGSARTWFFILPDLLMSIPEQALEAPLMIKKWPAVVASVAIGLSVAMIVVGGGDGLTAVVSAFGVIIAVFVSLSLWMMTRSRRGAEFSYGSEAPKTWNWWTVLTGILATTYVVAGTGQLIDETKATNVGALCIAVFFAALMAGGLILRARGRTAGNFMVAAGAVPSLAFFWMIVPPLVGLAILVGAVAEVSQEPTKVPQTT